MFALVYRVLDLVQLIDHKKKNPPKPLPANHIKHITGWEDPYQVDETLIDPTLTECWVVYGPCLPKVNGSYEYQKDYTKATAEKFNHLVNALSADGYKGAQANMRQAMGLDNL